VSTAASIIPPTAPAESPAGVADVERLQRAMREVPPPPRKAKKRGRPPLSRLPHLPKPDLELPPEFALEDIAPKDRIFWGHQLQHFFESLAAQRGPHWVMPEEVADAAGEPMARCVRKYAPAAEERPELVLAIVLVPFIFSAASVEYEKFQHRATARRDARGDLRPERLREDHPGTVTVGTPLEMSDR
jgi:hypothetical protein